MLTRPRRADGPSDHRRELGAVELDGAEDAAVVGGAGRDLEEEEAIVAEELERRRTLSPPLNNLCTRVEIAMWAYETGRVNR